MGKFYCTKTYNTDRGLSCAFRQWRATHSNCRLVHGYSLGFRVVFECDELDERNWSMDFGGLKFFKEWLVDTFDHKLVVAKDDPEFETLKGLADKGLANLIIVESVGVERFAELAFNKLDETLEEMKKDGKLLNPTVRVKSVECFEHGANAATYERQDDTKDLERFGLFKGIMKKKNGN